MPAHRRSRSVTETNADYFGLVQGKSRERVGGTKLPSASYSDETDISTVPHTSKEVRNVFFNDKNIALDVNARRALFEDSFKPSDKSGSAFTNYNPRTGFAVKTQLKSASIPYPGDVHYGAAQELAKRVASLSRAFVEVQCAVTKNKAGEYRYILSSNSGRDQLMEKLDEVLETAEREQSTNRSARLRELIDAIKNDRIRTINNATTEKICAQGTAKMPAKSLDGLHAETLFLKSEDVLKAQGVLARDHDIVKVVGVRRPCADCTSAFIAAGKLDLISTSSEAQPKPHDKQVFPVKSKEYAATSAKSGNQYLSSNSHIGYYLFLDRMGMSDTDAFKRIGDALEEGTINVSRHYGGKPDATPITSPLSSRAASPAASTSGDNPLANPESRPLRRVPQSKAATQSFKRGVGVKLGGHFNEGSGFE